ncbi:MAG: pilin [Candidatus Pacebacteria bacterium]|nr:pilin [Candidatus Paceibacterota bacterium]
MNSNKLKEVKDGIFLTGIFVFIFLPLFSTALASSCDPSLGVVCNPLSSGGSGVDTVTEAIIVIIKFLLSIIGLISMLFIVIAGIRYMISAGNEEKIRAAKESFTSAFSGIVLALMAYGIITAIEEILQVN